MGWITCCNVLSDLYAMGVVNCDNMLLLLGVAQEMSATEREVCVKLLMEGFRDCALEANTFIRGGQTVLSPWLMIGGVATSVCTDSEYIMQVNQNSCALGGIYFFSGIEGGVSFSSYFFRMMQPSGKLSENSPNRANYGDVLVLTKPLGTQVAVNAYQWMRDQHTFWTQTLRTVTTEDEVRRLFSAATLSMTHLNRNGKLILFHIPRGINIPDTFTSSALTCLPRDFSSSN
ncbi:SPS1 [Fasciolopsis buskii]|uniref:SPS1 n=1 Tax=Fasciolopsis buskii TaxID=27845 RepID=A0A8E0RYY7_9TREM|nr:SPS1 [Fasciolopsis buski]